MEYTVKEKYAHMIRVYHRFAQISINNGEKISNAEAKDTAEEFFNQCYHLKDYFKKDESIKNKQDVEEYITNNFSLSIAADYCNTFKHSGLDKNHKKRFDKDIEQINTHIFIFHPTPEGRVNFSRLELKVDGESYDVFAITTECVNAWNQFFKIHNRQDIIDEGRVR